MKEILISRSTRGEIVSARIDGIKIRKNHDLYVMERAELEEINYTSDLKGMIIMVKPQAHTETEHYTELVPMVTVAIMEGTFDVTLAYHFAGLSDQCIGCYSLGVQDLRVIRELAQSLAAEGVLKSEHPDWNAGLISHVLHVSVPTGSFHDMFAQLDQLVGEIAAVVSEVASETDDLISNVVESSTETITKIIRS